MERIIIRHFGPIGFADIEIKRITILAGPANSGKSTIAKLICIFQHREFGQNPSREVFERLLTDYNIDFAIREETFIKYQHEDFFIEIRKDLIGASDSSMLYNDTIFIPAERMLIPLISQSIFGLINNDIALPKFIIDFGAQFEQARHSIKEFYIDFLDVTYSYDGYTDYVKVKGVVTVLSKACSTFQLLVPAIVVIQYYAEKAGEGRRLFVIEEPELGLSLILQKDFIEFVIRCMRASDSKLIATTQSSYVLGAIKNIISGERVVFECR